MTANQSLSGSRLIYNCAYIGIVFGDSTNLDNSAVL